MSKKRKKKDKGMTEEQLKEAVDELNKPKTPRIKGGRASKADKNRKAEEEKRACRGKVEDNAID